MLRISISIFFPILTVVSLVILSLLIGGKYTNMEPISNPLSITDNDVLRSGIPMKYHNAVQRNPPKISIIVGFLTHYH